MDNPERNQKGNRDVFDDVDCSLDRRVGSVRRTVSRRFRLVGREKTRARRSAEEERLMNESRRFTEQFRWLSCA